MTIAFRLMRGIHSLSRRKTQGTRHLPSTASKQCINRHRGERWRKMNSKIENRRMTSNKRNTENQCRSNWKWSIGCVNQCEVKRTTDPADDTAQRQRSVNLCKTSDRERERETDPKKTNIENEISNSMWIVNCLVLLLSFVGKCKSVARTTE